MSGIMCIGIGALHDTSSAQNAQILELLKSFNVSYNNQVDLRALCSFVFCKSEGQSAFNNLDEAQKGEGDVFEIKDGFPFYYVKNTNRELLKYTNGEMRKLFMVFLELLNKFKPDVILSYGDDFFVSSVSAESSRRNIPQVHFALKLKNEIAQGYADFCIDSKKIASYKKDINTFAKDLLPLLSKKASVNPQYFRSGYAYK